MGLRFWIVAGITTLLIPNVTADPVEDEVKRLEGTWIVLAATLNGNPLEADEQAIRFVFAGTKVKTILKNGKIETFSFKVDPARKPKALDVVPEDKAKVAKIGAAIYELSGDNLKICIGDPRPKVFTDEDQPLFVLKRKK